MIASSGNATKSAFAFFASRSQAVIRRTFPSRSPTVGFICTMAIRKVRIDINRTHTLLRVENIIVREKRLINTETRLPPNPWQE